MSVNGRGTREFGDFFTPEATAQAIAKKLWPKIKVTYRRTGRPVRILEPACGTGNLILPLIELSRRDNIPLEIVAVEVQKDYLGILSRLLKQK
jgi:type I restriction-modification system DNA methylase subunit